MNFKTRTPTGRLSRLLQCALLLAVLMSLAPNKMQAQWTVFDPTSFTEMTEIWNQDVSTNVKLAEEIAQMTSLVTQTMQIYSLAKTEASYIQKGQMLQAVGFFAEHASIPGHAEWDKAMSTTAGLANAGMVWSQMLNPNMSLRNRMAMTDSFALSALNSLGSCNSAAQLNGGALNSLETIVLSADGGSNTAASQRNLSNMSSAQQLRYQQCQENLAEQRLKLQMIQAHETRDRDQAALNTYNSVDVYNAADGGQWDTSPEADYRRTGMH